MLQMFLGKVNEVTVMADCTKCRHMYHICNEHTRPNTMFCDVFGKANQYCKTVNPHGGCQKFDPIMYHKMSLEDASRILLENRPDRPRSTKQRQLQAAIDVILPYLSDLVDTPHI